ncbi:RNA polymerase sigma factor [Streptomyces sp. NPDC059786]|uniref:RNA polymerase sigma factor n=1 Tax=Streptomyces sp. NPDC059786 TaxID=3346946 RepID=UPI00364F4E0F
MHHDAFDATAMQAEPVCPPGGVPPQAGTGHRPDPGQDFDEIFSALLPRLYRRSAQLTGRTSHSAEDAVHDAYLKLAARPQRFLSHPDPYAYAFSALLSVIRDRLRRERRLVPTGDSEAPAAGAWDGGVERRTARMDLVHLLASLTPRQASSVILVDIDDYTLDQAAAIMGVHPGTVARTRARALSLLRRRARRDDAQP